MNGRVYDYNVGRFLGVDPFLQFPENSQSANPYSYIMNNPMSGTDPTGYTAETDKEEAIGGPEIKATISTCAGSAQKTCNQSGQGARAVDISAGGDNDNKGSGGRLVKEDTGKNDNTKKGDKRRTNQSGGVTTSDGVTAVGVATGLVEHADTHPVWVGKNGQVKANNPNYHGNQHNGSKAGQIAKAKEIAKKLGIPLAAASALLRGVQLPDELATMRASGASQQDITLQKVDAGVDISMAGVGVLGLPGFAVAVGYTVLDYSTGGNASKALVDGVQNIPVPSAPKVPDGPGGMKTFMHRLLAVPEFNINP